MVSDGTAVPPECELFLPGGLWENVAYDSTNMHGENMYGKYGWLYYGFKSTNTMI